jgi:hypothetical protein
MLPDSEFYPLLIDNDYGPKVISTKRGASVTQAITAQLKSPLESYQVSIEVLGSRATFEAVLEPLTRGPQYNLRLRRMSIPTLKPWYVGQICAFCIQADSVPRGYAVSTRSRNMKMRKCVLGVKWCARRMLMQHRSAPSVHVGGHWTLRVKPQACRSFAIFSSSGLPIQF